MSQWIHAYWNWPYMLKLKANIEDEGRIIDLANYGLVWFHDLSLAPGDKPEIDNADETLLKDLP